MFQTKTYYRFLLRANPIKRLSKQRCRVPLIGEENLNAWLSRKFEGSATLVETVPTLRTDLNFCKGDNWGKITTIDFEGVIQCNDKDNLLRLVSSGIGTAKAFGCGLLLLKNND